MIRLNNIFSLLTLQPSLKIIITSLLILTGCSQTPPPQTPTAVSSPAPPSPQPSPYTTQATLLAVGDVMMHKAQIDAGYQPQTQTYSYDHFFAEVRGILTQGDWVIANLETPLAGAAAGYTGYPLFNAPKTLANALKNAGFNLISTTNNHSLDRGEAGVVKTLNHLEAQGLETVGTYRTPEDAQNILVTEKQDISMATLAYTESTNGIPLPPDKPYLVSQLSEANIIADIERAKALDIDLITVILHFGVEYQRQPTSQQKQLVANLVKAGADIILGSHPHVVQPYQRFEVTEANGETREAVAIYSMGNFIAYQVGSYKDLGVIFGVTVQKSFPDEAIEITEIEAIPTYIDNYTRNGKLDFRTLPIASTLSTPDDLFLPPPQYRQLESYLTQMNQHLTSLPPVTLDLR